MKKLNKPGILNVSPLTLTGGVEKNVNNPIAGRIAKLVKDAANVISGKTKNNAAGILDPSLTTAAPPTKAKSRPTLTAGIGWAGGLLSGAYDRLKKKSSQPTVSPETNPVYEPEYPVDPYIPKEADKNKTIKYSTYTGDPFRLQATKNVGGDAPDVNLGDINLNLDLEPLNLSPQPDSNDSYQPVNFQNFLPNRTGQQYYDYISGQARQEYNDIQTQYHDNPINDVNQFKENSRWLSSGKAWTTRGMSLAHMAISGNIGTLNSTPHNERTADGLTKLVKLMAIQTRLDKAHEAIYGPRTFRIDDRGKRTAVPWYEISQINIDNAFKYRQPPTETSFNYPSGPNQPLINALGIRTTDDLERFIDGLAIAMTQPPGSIFLKGGGGEAKTNGMVMQATGGGKVNINNVKKIIKNTPPIKSYFDTGEIIRDYQAKEKINKNKKVINNIANKNGIPSEMIGGIVYNETDPTGAIRDFGAWAARKLGRKKEPTVGIAQISPVSAMTEMNLGFDPKVRKDKINKYCQTQYYKTIDEINTEISSIHEKLKTLNHDSKAYIDLKAQQKKLFEAKINLTKGFKNLINSYYSGSANNQQIELLRKTLKTDYAGNIFNENAKYVNDKREALKQRLEKDDVYSLDYLGRLLKYQKLEKYPNKAKLTDDEMTEIVRQYNGNEGYAEDFKTRLPLIRNLLK